MRYLKNYFKNKKILVMGLGFHGGGIAVTRWLAEQGAKVIVTDLKTKKELSQSLEKLKSLPIKLHLGKHQSDDFKKSEIIIQNPAVARESKFLKIAKKLGIQIENEATLFFKLRNPRNIIGVTGTRGKSTVSTLLYEILKNKFKNIRLAGNIGVIAMFDIVDQMKKDNLAILELSSWHLENLGEQRISPHISIVTNIMPDHLNRYRSINDYIEAKVNILKYQSKDDIAILNRDDKNVDKMGKLVKGRRYWFSGKYFSQENGCFIKNKKIIFRENGKEIIICTISDIKMPGKHNIQNVLAVVTAASILGVKAESIKNKIKQFKGMPSRIEFIKSAKGVKYYNDTTSTMPDATIAALQTLGKAKNIILIAGGVDKKLEYKKLAKMIKKHCKTVVLFKGSGGDKIHNELKKVQYNSVITKIDSMVDAVAIANSFSKPKDIVLLSPACASFNLFTNEFDRGAQFIEIVNKL